MFSGPGSLENKLATPQLQPSNITGGNPVGMAMNGLTQPIVSRCEQSAFMSSRTWSVTYDCVVSSYELQQTLSLCPLYTASAQRSIWRHRAILYDRRYRSKFRCASSGYGLSELAAQVGEECEQHKPAAVPSTDCNAIHLTL
jgi:hypothetical protein